MKTRLRSGLAIGVAAIAVAAIVGAACGGDVDDAVDTPDADEGLRVASFDFAESAVLSELYAQMVESTGTPVARLGAVGPREIVMPALELGLVDLVPEYLGTALRRLGVTESITDTRRAHAELDARLDSLGLTALAVARAQDQNVVVVTEATAAREGLDAISDLVPLAPALRFGGPPECPDRPLCLLGLERVYGLHFAEFVAQPTLRFTAEALRRGEIDVGLMFSTAPALADTDLEVLDDDRGLQPAENIVPVARADALTRWGAALEVALGELSAALTTTALQGLNRRVDEGESVEQVAHDWLTANGLLTTG